MLRDYAKVSPEFWMDKELRALPMKIKLTALYLMSSPLSTMDGFYYLPLSTIAFEVQLTPQEVIEALDVLTTMNFCRYDHKKDYVWVIDMAEREVGSLNIRDNRVKNIRKHLKQAGDVCFKNELFDKYQVSLCLLGALPDPKSPSQAP